MTALALLLGLACAGRGCGTDPDLARQVQAAETWDRGKAALQAGAHAEAATLFEQAAALDPASPVLLAWQARALEQGGQETQALAVLDAALDRFPEDVELRFSRAALRARAGALDEAAVDLHLLLSQGQLDPQDVASDADLQRLRQRPELAALVPDVPLQVHLQGEAGGVLLGERYTAELGLVRPAAAPGLQVRSMGESTGLLRRTRVVEDLLEQGSWRVQSRLELTWRAVAPGEAQAGPWLFSGGGSSALTESLSVEVVAVGSRREPHSEPGPEDLVIPSLVVGDRQPPWAGELLGGLAVLAAPEQQVQVLAADGSEASAAEQWELRHAGQPQWTLRLYPGLARAHVEVREGPGPPRLSADWP